MIWRRFTAVFFGAIIWEGFLGRAVAASFISDDFRYANLALSHWQWVNPRDDATLHMTGSELVISVPGGVNHDIWAEGNYAPTVMQSADNTDFELEVKFISLPSQQYQIQGVLIQQDARNFLRFDFHSDGRSLRVFAASFTQGSPSAKGNTIIGATGPLYMRIRRTGNTWVQSYSYDGLNWTLAANFEHVLNVASVGPFVGNSGTSPAFTGVIDYFFNNAAPISPEDNGPLPTDTTAPLLQNIRVAIRNNQADVTWTTDEPANGVADYGTTTSLELGAVAHSDAQYQHAVALSGLQPGRTYYLRVSSTDAQGNASSSDITSFRAPDSNGPSVNVWYGNAQRFGELGRPQPWLNIVGNVSGSNSIAALKYALNGGPRLPLTIGPDSRRLSAPGDFNIELPDTAVVDGRNTVEIVATDSQGNEGIETITVDYVRGKVWPTPYVLDWTTAATIQDVAQVVDGLWTLENDQVRTGRLGYDRIIALGDLSWTDYEVSVPVTIHGHDSTCLTQTCMGRPGIGVMLRWPGHQAWDASQPRWGWWPMGILGWYRWHVVNGIDGELRLVASGGNTVASHQRLSIPNEVPHILKLRGETVPGQGYVYHIKAWRQDQPEPSAWDLSAQQPLSTQGSGSVLLIAHHVDASFGKVTVTPLAGSSLPVIGNIGVSVTETTATISWETNENTTGSVTYGVTTAYEKGMITEATPTAVHSINLTGLIPGTLYHYQIASVDADGNIARSADLAFTTLNGASVGGPVTDNFDGSALDNSVWKRLDPRNDATFQVANGKLSISVPAGAGHDIWKSGNFAPRVMQVANNGDFIIEAKFDAPLTEKYQIQGVLVEQDSNNFLRFDFHSDGASNRVFAASFANGQVSTKSNIMIPAAAPLYLRIQRRGDQWTQAYSYNGVDWTTAATFNHSMLVQEVGVFAGNSGVIAPTHTALVDYFIVKSSAGPAPDVTPPNIENVQIVANSTTATVTWNTSESATGSVAHGVTTAYENGTVASSGTATTHNVTLTGLSPGVLYHYQIASIDDAGNLARSSDLTFNTLNDTPSAGPLSDHFDGAALRSDVWAVHNPQSDATVAVSGGKLSITVPAGTSHDIWQSGAFAPRIMQAAANTDFVIEAKYDSPLSEKYQIQGILIEQDGDNFLRFDLHSDGSRNRVFAASFDAGQPSVKHNSAISTNTPSYLRVQRRGDQWSQAYSYNGIDWITAVTFNRPLLVNRVGLFVGNSGVMPPAHTGIIDYFVVNKPL